MSEKTLGENESIRDTTEVVGRQGRQNKFLKVWDLKITFGSMDHFGSNDGLSNWEGFFVNHEPLEN